MAIIFDKNYNISCKEIIENGGYTQLDFTTTYDILCKTFIEKSSKPSNISVDKYGNMFAYMLEEQNQSATTVLDLMRSYAPTLSVDSAGNIQLSNFPYLLSRIAEITGNSEATELAKLHFFYIEKKPMSHNDHSDTGGSAYRSNIFVRRCTTYGTSDRDSGTTYRNLFDALGTNETSIDANGYINMAGHRNLIKNFKQTSAYKYRRASGGWYRGSTALPYLIIGIGVTYNPNPQAYSGGMTSYMSLNALRYSFSNLNGNPTVVPIYKPN